MRGCSRRRRRQSKQPRNCWVLQPDNVVLLANSSEALNLLANSIDWQAGDEVLISDLEFPSNVVVWLRLKELGVRADRHPDAGRSDAARGLDVASVISHACRVRQSG